MNKNQTLSLKAARLIIGFFCHTLTKDQTEELDHWLSESDENMQIFEEVLEVADPLKR